MDFPQKQDSPAPPQAEPGLFFTRGHWESAS